MIDIYQIVLVINWEKKGLVKIRYSICQNVCSGVSNQNIGIRSFRVRFRLHCRFFRIRLFPVFLRARSQGCNKRHTAENVICFFRFSLIVRPPFVRFLPF